jgi:exonuclease SbcD
VRFLHTSDWHLGRSLHSTSLHAAQEQAVNFIVDLAVTESVDCIVIAGDVFDRAIPPIESLRLLNRAIDALAEAGVTVIITAGNHDSGDRLATYSGVLTEGVHLVGSLDSVGTPVTLEDEFGPVLVYPLPYLEPDVARVSLSGDDEPLERSHEAVMRAAVDRIRRDLADCPVPAPRAVAIGHAFVANVRRPEEWTDASGITSESERDLTVGGVQVVPAGVFEGVGLQYVALGHLHRGHEVSGGDTIVRYSGSLLRYSFSEAAHDKHVVIVDIGAPGTACEIRVVSLPQPRPMSRLRDSIDALLSDTYAHARDHFVELVVTDDAPPERMHARLDAVFAYALRKSHEPANRVSLERDRGDARGKEPLDVIADFLRKVSGAVPDDAQLAILRAGYEECR